VEDIPDGELAEILEKRCALAPSYAARLVEVQRELQRRRQGSNVFAGKHGFITPRDLFRWGARWGAVRRRCAGPAAGVAGGAGISPALPAALCCRPEASSLLMPGRHLMPAPWWR
jgi:midasin